jgi:type IV pilus assembly protein PilN
MKISVNLATRPFIELRPLFARLRVLMAALVVVAVALGFALHVLSARAAEAEQKMGALKGRTAQLQNEKLSDEARMRQPQNAAVLARSRFLNDLFAHKSFSWTAVMMDLEDVLPGGVQVTSIEPSIDAAGGVHIRLKVSGDRDRAVQLVRNLETSKRFLMPRLSDESMQAQNEGSQRAMTTPGGVEFDILAGYNPLPAADSEAATEKTGKTEAPAKGSRKTSGTRRAGPKKPDPGSPKGMPPVAKSAQRSAAPAAAASGKNHVSSTAGGKR